MKNGEIKRIALSLALVSMLWGCASTGNEFKTSQGDPGTLYTQGLILFNMREYLEALKKFEELKTNYPDSPPFTVLAELKVADCHFLEEKYIEALSAYEEFTKNHPTHPDMPYVQYQIGMSHFNQMLSEDRDQTPAQKALSSFEQLVSSYPPSLFTEKAKKRIDTCMDRLADHEFYIGNFYYKKENYQAAAHRFEKLLVVYPQTANEDKALFFLGKSCVELGQGEKAKAVFQKLLEIYPNSPYSKETKKILDQGVQEKKPVQGLKAAASGTGDGKTAERLTGIPLVRFEEEARSPIPLEDGKKIEAEQGIEKGSLQSRGRETSNPPPVKDEAKIMTQEGAKPVPAKPSGHDGSLPFVPSDEGRKSLSPVMEPATDTSPGVKQGRVATRPPAAASLDGDKAKKESALDPEVEKFLKTGQPVDITSDRVEAYSKDNRIYFSGNVTVRQKDVVIYADSLEAFVVEDGKGIEKVVADGNVKVQQGLRVASCQKAIFNNIDKKVVLTGEPKVWEGDNLVTGDEIIFDIEKNRVEVKGGSSGRGKATIYSR